MQSFVDQMHAAEYGKAGETLQAAHTRTVRLDAEFNHLAALINDRYSH